MGLFVKIAPVEFNNASRDKKEISVVKELGHNVIVVAKSPDRVNEKINIEGWDVHCRSTRPLSQNRLLAINRFFSIFTWALYIRRLGADYLSGHNMLGLLIAWISTWFQSSKRRPILIYDAHEFETALYEKRSFFKRQFMIHLERFLIKRSTFIIVVNESIADEVQKLHELPKRPLVIRNLAPYWEIDSIICKQRREEFYTKLNFDIGDSVFIIMYHGGIIKNRGIENLIRAIARLENVAAIILGEGEHAYVQLLYDLVKEEAVTDKVLFYPAVPNKILWQYLGAVDAGVCILINTTQNHYYALPNKLFENIQSETPVIGSDFPEISRIIEGYNIGLTCDPHKVDDIVLKIEKMRNDYELYKIFKDNLKIAKNELCWEKEKMILINEYRKLGEMK